MTFLGTGSMLFEDTEVLSCCLCFTGAFLRVGFHETSSGSWRRQTGTEASTEASKQNLQEHVHWTLCETLLVEVRWHRLLKAAYAVAMAHEWQAHPHTQGKLLAACFWLSNHLSDWSQQI